jgi:release factor glutamine methyltransferase
VRLVVLPGVLRPPSDCWLLADVVRERGLARGRRTLDLFTGSGALAIVAAAEGGRSVTAVDIARRAVLNARLNARLNKARVRVLRGDMFAPLRGERFDLITANPPYVPGDADALAARGASRAWEAGPDGRAFLDRLCAGAAAHLAYGGDILLVQSSLSGERETLEGLWAAGLRADVVARMRGPLGPIASRRAGELERSGLLGVAEREEELLVIRGSAPRRVSGLHHPRRTAVTGRAVPG